MQSLKIVITGAYAAGKTQFIRSISEIEMVNTDFSVTLDEERELKRETTVALDFGTITVSERLKLYLFGTPGQERFDFMWEHLALGALGYVVMVDSTRPGHFAETQRLMTRFQEITDAPFIVAANKQDDPAAMPVGYVRRRLAVPPEIPVVPCVAAERSSVKQTLLSLLKYIAMNRAAQEPAAETEAEA